MKNLQSAALALTLMLLVFVGTSSFTTEDTKSSSPGTITWKAESFTTGYQAEGGFKTWSLNKFEMHKKQYGTLSAEIEIQIGSIYEESDGLVEHLKQWDFFYEEMYPTAVIKIEGAAWDKRAESLKAKATAQIKAAEFPIELYFNEKEGQPNTYVGYALINREFYEIGVPAEDYGSTITPEVRADFELIVPGKFLKQ